MSRNFGQFDPILFLELAEKLLRDSSYDERSRVRTVIGRSYYSAFLLTKKRLEEKGARISDDKKVHQEVISKAAQLNNMIGNHLFTLRDFRNRADYDLDSAVSKDTAQKCLTLSRLVSRNLKLL